MRLKKPVECRDRSAIFYFMRERPLSPHLQIYKHQITSVLSILHRISGAALTVGLIVLTAWLLSAASGPDAYGAFVGIMSSPLGLFALFGWSVALFYHLSTGLRHLVLDTGACLDIRGIYRSGYAALALAALLCALFWFVVLA